MSTNYRIQVGELNNRIKVQRRSATLGQLGHEIDSWSDIASVWARIRPVSGRERIKMLGVEPELTHIIYIRYRDDLTPMIDMMSCRIMSGNRIFNITNAFDLEEKKQFICFECVEGSYSGQ